MSSNNDNSIERLVREKLDGKSYSTIRRELSESGLKDDEIHRLIRQTDDRVLEELQGQEDLNRAQLWYRVGMVLAIIGLILSISYNAGILGTKLPALLIYSPFFAGILVMFYGRFKQRKQSVEDDSGTGAIRRRRPYK